MGNFRTTVGAAVLALVTTMAAPYTGVAQKKPDISQEFYRLAQDYAKRGKPYVTSHGILQRLDTKEGHTFDVQLWNGSDVHEASGISLPLVFSEVEKSSPTLELAKCRYLTPEEVKKRRLWSDGNYCTFYNVDGDGRMNCYSTQVDRRFRTDLIRGDGISIKSHSRCQAESEKGMKKFVIALKEYALEESGEDKK